jgi:hypothetical protein
MFDQILKVIEAAGVATIGSYRNVKPRAHLAKPEMDIAMKRATADSKH